MSNQTEILKDLIKDFEGLKKTKLYQGSFKAIEDCIMLTHSKINDIEELKVKNEGTHYAFVITTEKHKMLLGLQTAPETKYFFKDKEISVEKLIEILEKDV